MLPLNLFEVYHLSSRLSWSGLGPVETRRSGTNRSQFEIRPHVSQEMTGTIARGREMNREALRRDVTVDEDMRVIVLEGAETDHRAASIQAKIAAIAIVAATHRAVAQAADQGADVGTKHAELMTQQVETYLV